MTIPIRSQGSRDLAEIESLKNNKDHLSETSVFEKQKNFKQSISQVLCSRAPFEKTSSLIVQQLQRQCPTQIAKLENLKTEYPEMMKELKELGWAGLKNKYKDGMKQSKEKGMSYEQLRKVLVDASIEISLAAVQNMGYSDPGSHAAFGTPGWPSDVDTTYFPGKDVPQEVQALEKLIFDAIMLGEFGSLPGRLLDTESYIGQKGGPFAIEDQLKSEESKKNYSFLELTLAMTQIYEGNSQHAETDGVNSSEEHQSKWESFKREQLKQAEFYSNSYKDGLDEILADVESFKNEIAFQIDELAVQQYSPQENLPTKGSEDYVEIIQQLASTLKKENPEAYRKAAISYRGSALIGLSVAMDDNLKQIDSLSTQLRTAQDQLLKLDRNVSKDNLKKRVQDLEKQIEALRIAFSGRGGLRNLCFDEGYITYGALIVVVAKWGSQSAQRVLEGVGKKAEGRFLGENVIQSLAFTSEQRKAPTPRELISSQQENLGFYQNHFEHDKVDESLASQQKSFVKNSKYCERIYAANIELLHLLEKKAAFVKQEIDREPQTEKTNKLLAVHQMTLELLEKAEIRAFQASEVEKCKRRTELNETAATQILLQILKESTSKSGGKLSQDELKKAAELIASFFQQSSNLAEKETTADPNTPISGPRLDRFQTDYVKKTFDYRERYNMLMAKVLHYIGTEKLVSTDPIIITENPKLNTLIKGMVGFPIVTKQKIEDNREVEQVDEDLKKIFDEAEKITLEALHLDNIEEIEKFNDEMAMLSHQIRDLSYNNQVVESPANLLEVGNLQKTWQQAITYRFVET